MWVFLKRRPKNEDLRRKTLGLKRRPPGLKRRPFGLKRRPPGLKRRPMWILNSYEDNAPLGNLLHNGDLGMLWNFLCAF